MVITLVLIYLFAAFCGSVVLRPDELREAELIRRAKHSTEYKLRLRRSRELANLIVISRLGTWFFLILFNVLSTIWFGWFWGLCISFAAALFYPVFTRIKGLSRLSTNLYEKAEVYLLDAIEKTPYIWRFLRGRIPDVLVGEKAFASREDLADGIAASTSILDTDERLLLVNGLQFRDRKVKEIMTPRSVIQSVKRDEFLGPLVLDELHSLGHSRLPVIDGDLDHIIGVLHLRTLLSLDVKKSESAEKMMEPRVLYIHEDDSLQKALKNYVKQRHHLFIVVNKRRETVTTDPLCPIGRDNPAANLLSNYMFAIFPS